MFRTVDTNAVCQSEIQQQPSQNEKSFFLPSYNWYKRLLWHFVHKNLKLEIKRFLESKGNKVNKEWERITKLFIKIIFMLQKGKLIANDPTSSCSFNTHRFKIKAIYLKATSYRRKALKPCLIEFKTNIFFIQMQRFLCRSSVFWWNIWTPSWNVEPDA